MPEQTTLAKRQRRDIVVLKLLTQLYRTLLMLYPRHFRAEFSEEMIAVNGTALGEAANRGWLVLARTTLRELGSLPREALRQHLRRRDKPARVDASTWEGPPSRREMFVAMGVFVLPVVLIVLNNTLLSGAIQLLLLVVAAAFGMALLVGLVRGFPRWSLPYLGLALSAASFLFVFQWVADLASPAVLARLGAGHWDASTRLVLQGLWAGLMWLSLFVILMVVLGILALARRFSDFLRRIFQDWTQVSYILYGGVLMALVMAFEDYRYEEPYAVASSLCLAAGALLYLRCPQPWQRGMALLSGLTLAMWTAALGKWLIVPAQDWALWFNWHSPQTERWFEAQRTLLEWGWMVLFLLAPALIKRLTAVRAVFKLPKS
jgi:hypothetical protein